LGLLSCGQVMLFCQYHARASLCNFQLCTRASG
jgi:predicted small metal-binding protein